MNADGSFTTLQGEIPVSPSIQWKNAKAIPNKTLEPDGSISVFPLSGGGSSGTGDFPEAPNDEAIYGRKNKAWTEAVEKITYLSDLGKIKLNESDSVGFFSSKLDGSTITIDSYNKLKIVGLNGLLVDVNTLNHMLGVNGNVQLQLNDLVDSVNLLKEERSMLTVVQYYGDLTDVLLPQNGDIAIVREDVNYSLLPTIYVFISSWEYIGNLKNAERNFTTNPIILNGENKEIIGQLETENISDHAVTEIKLSNEIANKINSIDGGNW